MLHLHHLPSIKARLKPERRRRAEPGMPAGALAAVSPWRLRLLIFLKQVPSHRRLSRCCLISSMISGWIFSLSSLQKRTARKHSLVTHANVFVAVAGASEIRGSLSSPSFLPSSGLIRLPAHARCRRVYLVSDSFYRSVRGHTAWRLVLETSNGLVSSSGVLINPRFAAF